MNSLMKKKKRAGRQCTGFTEGSGLHSLAEKPRFGHEFAPLHITPMIHDPVRRPRLPQDPRNFGGGVRHGLPSPI